MSLDSNQPEEGFKLSNYKEDNNQLIRTKVIGIFRKNKKLLVGDAYDQDKDQLFYFPPGGGVEFGETSLQALQREIREELHSEIENPVLLDVMENLFTLNGKQGHEIVFVYSAELLDRSLYEVDKFIGYESNGEIYNAIWIELDAMDEKSSPVYPEGLVELLNTINI